VGKIFVYSLISAANATLLAAVTVMLFLSNPKRLLVGYLLGGLLVSLTFGFLIVFVVHHSGATSTTQKSISPAMDIALGVILLVVASVLRSEWIEKRRERKKQDQKGPSRVDRVLGRDSARLTFVVGVFLTLPGVSYLAALHELDELNYGTIPTILVILGFNAMILLLLEIPLIGYMLAPERTVTGVENFKAWLGRNGLKAAIYVAAGLGALLIIRGLIELLT
jgi:hypothetical protein